LAGAFLAAAAFGLAAAFGFFGLAFLGDAAFVFFGETGFLAGAFFGEAGFLAGAAFLVTLGFVGAAADGPVVAAAVVGAAAFVVFLAGALVGDFGLTAAFGFLTVFGFGDPVLATVFLTTFPPSVGFLSPKRKLPAAPIPFACFKTPVVTPRFKAVFK